MTEIEFTLPYPPSANKIWRYVGNKPRLSKAARNYRLNVSAAVFEAGNPRLFGRLGVRIILHAKDRRKRDIDNAAKAILDSLEAAYLFDVDEQIDDLHIRRGEIEPGGRAVVTLWQLEE